MDDPQRHPPFIGQIIMFGGNFAPQSWAFCDGQLLQVSQNATLFSVLGNTYGGATGVFNLPDMRGRLPIHQGTGPGLSPRAIGSKGGTETATLSVAQMPEHKHTQQGSTDQALTGAPAGKVTADSEFTIYSDGAPNTAMSTQAIGVAGGAQAHNNTMRFLCVNFIIALTGGAP